MPRVRILYLPPSVTSRAATRSGSTSARDRDGGRRGSAPPSARGRKLTGRLASDPGSPERDLRRTGRADRRRRHPGADPTGVRRLRSYRHPGRNGLRRRPAAKQPRGVGPADHSAGREAQRAGPRESPPRKRHESTPTGQPTGALVSDGSSARSGHRSSSRRRRERKRPAHQAARGDEECSRGSRRARLRGRAPAQAAEEHARGRSTTRSAWSRTRTSAWVKRGPAR